MQQDGLNHHNNEQVTEMPEELERTQNIPEECQLYGNKESALSQ